MVRVDDAVRPRLTIVTPSFNQAHLLAGLLRNIARQDCPQVEHIVIDGGSTDGTVALLQAHADRVRWVSEPDRGQPHALNKGFALAHGEILAWINCDDRFTPGALRLVVDYFAEHPDVDFVYGDALAADDRHRVYGMRWHVRPCDLADLTDLGDPIVQPAAFWRRRLWESVGELDETLDCAFDYEFWMRAAGRTTLRYLPVCLAVESIHADAKTSTGGLQRMAEIEQAARRHGGTGMPVSFRPEAAALHTRAALGAVLDGRLADARDHARAASALRPALLPYALHTAVACTVGPSSVPTLRLWANLSRAGARRSPLPSAWTPPAWTPPA